MRKFVATAGLIVAVVVSLTACENPKRKPVDVKTTVKMTVGKRF